MEVVILCGGKGTRSYPFTEYFPKVMMPIAGTPILVHLPHEGFWKSMDTSNDQQDLGRIHNAGSPPWCNIQPRAMENRNVRTAEMR